MKRFLKLYTDCPIILRIGVGLTAGILLGIFFPDTSFFALPGEVFVGFLKGAAPILVLTLVTSSLANAGEGIGGKFRTVIFLYLLSTFLAALVAVVGSFIFKITIPLGEVAGNTAPAGLGEVIKGLVMSTVANPVQSIAEGNYVGILTWSVIPGVVLKRVGSENTKRVLADIAEAVSGAVAFIIELAPIGIGGLVYSTVSTSGAGIFTHYGKLIALLVGCMLVVAFVTNPLIVWLVTGKNPYPLVFECIRGSAVTAFFTRSSAANIPVNMELCEKLGLEREHYSVAIPLGATINMNGAAVTITVISLAAAFSQGIEVNILMAGILCIVSALGACGASGIAGGSLLLVPMACSLLGVSGDAAMQAVAAGFVTGIVQDSFETAVNSMGDVLFCAAAELRESGK